MTRYGMKDVTVAVDGVDLSEYVRSAEMTPTWDVQVPWNADREVWLTVRCERKELPAVGEQVRLVGVRGDECGRPATVARIITRRRRRRGEHDVLFKTGPT